jgi:hypothetical protein
LPSYIIDNTRLEAPFVASSTRDVNFVNRRFFNNTGAA